MSESNKVMIVIGLIAVVAGVVGGVVYMNNQGGSSVQPAPAEIVTPLCTALKGYACAVAQQEAAYSQQLRAALADFYVILADKTAHVAAIEDFLTSVDNPKVASDLAFLKAVNLPPLPEDYRAQSEAGQSADDKKVIEALRAALLPDPTASGSLFDLLEQRAFAYKPLEDNRNNLLNLLK